MTNLEDLNPYIQKIAKSLMNLVLEPFEYAEINATLEEGVVTESSHYVTPSGEDKDLDLEVDFIDQIEELRDLMSGTPNGAWDGIKIRIDSTGKHTLNFTYPKNE